MHLNFDWINQLGRRGFPLWPQSWAQAVPFWLTLLAGAMLAWLVIRLFWLLLAGPVVPLTFESSWQGPSLSTDQRHRGQGSAVLWSLLFEGQSDQRFSDLSALPVDRSALTLVGVVVGQSPENSLALIRGVAGRDQAFRVGERLPDGRELEAIQRDRVVLSGAGRQEVLVLLDRELNPASSQARRSLQADQDNEQASGVAGPLPMGIGIGSLGQMLGQALPSLDRTDIGGVQMVAVRGGGFRLRPSSQATWFAAAGLRVGDVLVNVNGQPAEAVAQSPDALEGLIGRVLQGERITLTVERDGQRLTLQPSMDDLRDSMNNRM